MMDAQECMKTRRSIRAYREAPLPRAIIEDIVDCGRLAATAMNNQPWAFVVVQDKALRFRIQEILGHAEFVRQAPCLIVVFYRQIDFAVEDASAATQNLLNAAWANGLGSCWIAGKGMDYAPRVAALLQAPQDFQLFSIVSIGHPAESPKTEKRPLSEQLHWERFGVSAT
jgi:nitroreductase